MIRRLIRGPGTLSVTVSSSGRRREESPNNPNKFTHTIILYFSGAKGENREELINFFASFSGQKSMRGGELLVGGVGGWEAVK